MRKPALAAFVAALCQLAATNAAAEEAGGPHFTFGASTSFVYDINEPNGGCKYDADGNPETLPQDCAATGENRKLYADGESEESFNIDLVQLGVSGSRGIVDYGAKIDFGDWADAIEDNIDGDVALQEMFMAIHAPWVTITAGRIPTPIGYEVLEPWANPNISRSRAWWYQPISHDGVALSGAVGPVTLMAAVVNGMHISDQGATNPDDEYGVIASMSVPFGSNDFRFSAIYSDEEDKVRNVELNAYLGGTWDRWRYALESTWLDGDTHGPTPALVPPDFQVWDVTGYAGATFGSWSGDARLSYTDQEGTNQNFFNVNDEGIVSFTLTGGYEIVEGVVVRAEYRVDSSSDPVFDDHDSGINVAGSFGQDDIVNVVQVQLLWTPATGQD
jgi:hypothetical protein